MKGKTKYIFVDTAERFKLGDKFPSAGPRPNITGMRNNYWGEHALIIKAGIYIYNLTSDPELFNRF